MSLERVLAKVSASGQVAAIGLVAPEVMRLVSDPATDFKSVGRLIENDPSLTARLLKVANSPYYGVRGKGASVERAVGLMGLNEVRNITLSVTVIAEFTGQFGGKTLNWEKFWEHSSGCALIAKVLAKSLHLPLGGQEYVTGLLHDVGKILLGHHFPEEFRRALELAAIEQMSMEEAETRVFGTDHGQVGEWAARQWDFPGAVRSGIADHHHPARSEGAQLLAAVVRLADVFAKAKAVGCGGDALAACVTDDPAWSIVARARPQVDDLDVERFTFDLDAEIDAARALICVAGSA